ncbi:MAG: hypothetical protein J0M07_07995 [Anaerolineae bacterium]|nr:hypothetical protein [Anaerolineae bacterium]
MRYRFWLLIGVMIAVYVLPWVINPGVSLTLGGYDLGEWTSLHEAVRGEQPPLLTSFLLRLPLALIAMLVGMQPHPPALSPGGEGAKRLASPPNPLSHGRGDDKQPHSLTPSPKGEGVHRWVLPVLVILLITVALLPPLEILDYPNDPNYQQQALVAGIALVGGLIGVSGIVRRVDTGLRVGISAAGTAAVLIGLSKAYQLMQGFNLPVSVGLGGVLLAALFAAVAVLAAVEWRSSRRMG